MDRKASQGRHGGNRGSADTRTGANPTRQAARTGADSLENNRNVSRAGGRKLGVE